MNVSYLKYINEGMKLVWKIIKFYKWIYVI